MANERQGIGSGAALCCLPGGILRSVRQSPLVPLGRSPSYGPFSLTAVRGAGEHRSRSRSHACAQGNTCAG